MDHALADAYLEHLTAGDPLSATRSGGITAVPHLPRLSPDDMAVRAQQARRLLRQVPDDGDLDHALIRHGLRLQLDEIDVGAHLLPALIYIGFHVALPRMLARADLTDPDAADHALRLLAEVPGCVEGVTQLLREGMDRKVTYAEATLDILLGELRPYVDGSPDTSPLGRALDGRGQGRWQAHADRVVAEQVVPALAGFAGFLRADYAPACRPHDSLRSVPGGPEIYAVAIRRMTSTDADPAEVHELGHQELSRIDAERRRLAGEEVHDLAAHEESLRTRHRVADPDRLLGLARAEAKRIDPEVVRVIGQLPRHTWRVEPMVDAGEHYPWAFAEADPAGRIGTVHLNTARAADFGLHTLTALLLHEGVPGHLLQAGVLTGMQLHPYRMGDLLTYNALTEGWALYCESLGHEMGLYDTPERAFGALTLSAHRAARLILDTGIHALGWDRSKATEEGVAATGLAREDVAIEVARYVSAPGQALAYKLGELALRDLAGQARERLGAAWDLRGFHDEVLRLGPVTLDVLTARMEEWMTSQAEASTATSVNGPHPAAVRTRATRTTVQHLADEAWAALCAEDPELAVQSGEVPRLDHLGPVGPDVVGDRIEWRRAILAQLDVVDTAALAGRDQDLAALLHDKLALDLQALDLEAGSLPLLYPHGWLAKLASLPGRVKLDTSDDVDAYLKVLGQIPDHVDGHLADMDVGAALGYHLPTSQVDVVRQFVLRLVSERPEDSSFVSMVSGHPAVSEATIGRFAQTVKRVVKPAMERVLAYVDQRLGPTSRATDGLSELPNGRELYRVIVAQQASTTAAPEEIHERGLAEVARIEDRMRALLADAGIDADMDGYAARLRADRSLYFESGEEAITAWRAQAKLLDGRIDEMIGRQPRMPYAIRPLPEEIATSFASPGYVQPPTGGQPGVLYCNMAKPDLLRRTMVPSLMLHECVPGHLIQHGVAAEIGLHPFQAHRPNDANAYREGWGLYCESLGHDLGLYTDPAVAFEQLDLERLRACRLVGDTGVNALQWTAQDARDYLVDHSAIDQRIAHHQVDRFIGMPGQNLAYKIGELAIRDQRRRAEAQLGQRFSLQEFHDVVLATGPVTLSVLDAAVGRWLYQ